MPFDARMLLGGHTVNRPREKVPTNLVRVMGHTPILSRSCPETAGGEGGDWVAGRLGNQLSLVVARMSG